ncbi:MAG: DNA primase [Thermaerobacterales bacterium]
MNRGRDEVVEEVRHRNDIVDVISTYVSLKRAGRNLVGLCPFHEERTPSFTVAADKQMYYCFGCQMGGDVFHFMMQKEGVDFREALERLAARAGITLPEPDLGPAARRRLEKLQVYYQAMETAVRFYEQQLRGAGGAKAQEYLIERGLTGETARAFRLGWAPDQWDGLLTALKSRFDPRILEKAGLVAARKEGDGHYDRFRGRIMYPINDERGRVIALGGRILEPDAAAAKYLNSPEGPLFQKRRAWYALDRARGAIRGGGRALVVEGYMDAVACHAYGFHYAVASLGTALSQEQAEILTRYARRILIAYDADAAGQAAALRGLENFRRVGDIDVRVVDLPIGADPDDFLRAHGAEAFSNLLEEALPLLEWRFRLACEQHDPESVEGKVEVVDEIVPWLAPLENAVAYAGYVRDFAERLQVPPEALNDEVRKYRRERASQGVRRRPDTVDQHKTAHGRDNNTVVTGRSHQTRPGTMASRQQQAERELLRLMLQQPALSDIVWSSVSAGDFAQEDHRVLAQTLAAVAKDRVAGDENKSFERVVLESVEDEAARQLISRLLVEDFPQAEDPARTAAELATAVRLGKVDEQRRLIAAEIRRLEKAGEEVPADLIRRHDRLMRQYHQQSMRQELNQDAEC